MTENEAFLALSCFSIFGSQRIRLLVAYYKSAAKVWKAPLPELKLLGVSENLLKQYSNFRNQFNFNSYLNKLKSLGINFVSIGDELFPNKLRLIEGSPLLLYYKGDIKILNNPAIAIVGSRKASEYGIKVTSEFSYKLARAGYLVVSGLARGIDTFSHIEALSAEGLTASILGLGLDRVYPSENVDLAQKIVKSGGVLISEYPPGTPPLPQNFVARNRIISGLSNALLVIEGAERSGTLITAKYALEQGKEIYVVPGNIYSKTSFVPNLLIKEGAIPVTTPEEVIDNMKLLYN